MFNEYLEAARKPLRELYQLMLVGRLDEDQKRRKKTLCHQLRNMGLLSLPFSLSPKKFQPFIGE